MWLEYCAELQGNDWHICKIENGNIFSTECSVVYRHYGRIKYGVPRPTPLWRDLVKILATKPRYASSFSLECTDFKNVIFKKIHWAPSEVAEVAEVKQPRNSKQ